MDSKDSMEKVVSTVCSSHCGGSCLLKVHIKNGKITHIESDDNGNPPFRGCLRGRSYRERVYHPDRLKYPMKRVGERGDGIFERISWDEAFEKIAAEIKRINTHYSPSEIILHVSAGDIVSLHQPALYFNVLSKAGGYTQLWGTHSYEAGIFSEFITYGTTFSRNTRESLLDSKLIIMWGWNPADTIQDSPTNWIMTRAKEAGARVISVDPRYTNSAAVFADQWVPIRPGTDTAVLIAMAYVMIKEDLHDKSFLETYTHGFEHFEQYVLGKEDGVEKTPSWAESISGAPTSAIEKLAVEYATVKPAALMAGISPGRTAYGEQYHRAAITLTAMTGNIGISGGNAAGRSYATHHSLPFQTAGLSSIAPEPNPLLFSLPPRKRTPSAYYEDLFWGWATARGHANRTQLAEAILKGKAGGFPSDYRMLFLVSTNIVNQLLNTNKMIKALKALEFVVVTEQLMTATAKYADILLPVNTFFERNDFVVGEGIPIYGYQNKVIDSLYESKSHLEIASGLASHLGIKDFYNNMTEDELLRKIVAETEIPDYESFKREGIYRIDIGGPYIAFYDQIKDPENNPFPTPSGKIEIYSNELEKMGHPELPPIPKYIETWESVNDSLAKKYPFQLITTHFKRRSHTQFENIPWLRELEPHAALINPSDAETRGISNGDWIEVYNDRGRINIKAKVTERIMPGVVDVPAGGWYNPDDQGIDQGGCCNVLTNDKHSPGGAFCSNTTLVDIQKK